MQFPQGAICLFLLSCILYISQDISAQEAWSAPATWPGGQVPQAGEMVTIPVGKKITLDVSPPALAGLLIEGELVVADQDLQLTAHWVLVEGLFQIGREDRPFSKQFTLTLNGPDEDFRGMGGRFLGTINGGSLEFHGSSASKKSWTQLAQNAFLGATSLMVAEKPTNWRVGDEIALAPSGYDPYEAERLTITAINERQVSFTPALKYNHWGKLQEYTGKTVDERAEVGLLSRNIIIQGPENGRAEHFGAHTMIMSGSGAIRLEGVAFHRMGQPGREARYSFHWHLAGDRKGDYIKHCSVVDALQRGIVVHGTDNVLVEENVTFNVQNHAFIPAEDGNEMGNQFYNNLAILTRRVDEGFFAFPVEGKESKLSNQGEQRPSGFWLRNLHNPLIGNHAAGAERGNGFFFDVHGRHRDFKHFDVLPQPIVFQDNVAHSCSVPGVNNNAGSNVAMYAKVGHGMGLFVDNFFINDEDNIELHFERFTAYKNAMSGIWNEVKHIKFTDLVLADNTSAFLSGEALIEDALVIGQTADTIGGRNRVLRHGNQRTGYYTVTQGGKKKPRFKNATFINMHEGTEKEAAAFIVDYKLDLRENFVEGIQLQNSRAAWMETRGAPGRTPSGAMLFDADGSLSGYDEPTMFLHPTSPLVRPDCDFVEEWNAYLCPADQFINIKVPRWSRGPRFRFYLDQPDGQRIHDGGLNTRLTRARVKEELTVSFDEETGPLEAYRIGFFPHGTSPSSFVYLRIPYPFPGVRLEDALGTTIPRGTSEGAVRNANQTAYFFDAKTGWIFLKAYASGNGDADGIDWVDIAPGDQEEGDITSSEDPRNLVLTESRVYPNPISEATKLYLSLNAAAEVIVNLRDPLGRLVTNAFQGVRSEGSHTIPLRNLEELPPGVYLLEVEAGANKETILLHRP